MVVTSLNHPPFSAGHVLATTQNCSGTHPKDSGKEAKTMALVLLVVVIVINQRVNKRDPSQVGSASKIRNQGEDFLQVFIEIFRQ